VDLNLRITRKISDHIFFRLSKQISGYYSAIGHDRSLYIMGPQSAVRGQILTFFVL